MVHHGSDLTKCAMSFDVDLDVYVVNLLCFGVLFVTGNSINLGKPVRVAVFATTSLTFYYATSSTRYDLATGGNNTCHFFNRKNY